MLKRSIICSIVLVLLFIPAVQASAAADESAVIGTASSILVSSGKQNGRYEECTLGDAVADALVRFTEADLAIVNGGCLKGNIIQGEVTEDEIADVIEDCEVVTMMVSARELYEMMEKCLSHVSSDGKGGYSVAISEHPAFPQISGFRVTYNPADEPYARVSRITIADKALGRNDTQLLKVALPLSLVEGELQGIGTNVVITGKTLISLMKEYVSYGMDDYYTPPKRIIPQGIHSSVFPDRYAVFTLLAVCALLFVLLLPLAKKMDMFHKQSDAKKGESSDK